MMLNFKDTESVSTITDNKAEIRAGGSSFFFPNDK